MSQKSILVIQNYKTFQYYNTINHISKPFGSL